MDLIVCNRTGVVHRADCEQGTRSAYATEWTPETATTGETAHEGCLPTGMPHVCVHCRATVVLADVPNAAPHHPRQGWSDERRHPFYCPHAISLNHSVIDRRA